MWESEDDFSSFQGSMDSYFWLSKLSLPSSDLPAGSALFRACEVFQWAEYLVRGGID
jgi:hypothetical protein